MTLSYIEIQGFRSIRRIRMPLRRLTVLVGANGVGKTNLYRSLELLHAAATGTLAHEIAREGGLNSIFWAGGRNLSPDGSFDPKYRTDGLRKSEGNRLTLEARLEDMGDDGAAMTYRLELGYPTCSAAAFTLEAQVKAETLTMRSGQRNHVMMERKGPAVFARDSSGKRTEDTETLLPSETALAHLGNVPALAATRMALANWRFYHSFRTDPDSPLRRPAPAVTAPMLASNGSNLAAVLATLRFIRGDTADLDEAIGEAFPGARLEVDPPDDFATFSMIFPETPKRPFGAHELSDGTLQFLALAGALLAYRLPPFIALNEPETSIHPNLIPALARLISRAAERTQIWVVTHSRELADALADSTGALPREVIRKDGATWIEGLHELGLTPEEDD
ncbi:MAG TPA: AAA family ATPase [Devosia sp.]|nr:AAA family ATPase [Devosia sp.]